MKTIKQIIETLPQLEDELPIFRVEAEMDKIGVPQVTAPTTKAVYPDNISEIADNVLSDLYGTFMSWQAYVSSLQNKHRARTILLKNAISIYSSQLKRKFILEGKMKPSDAKLAIEMDTDLMAMENSLSNYLAEEQIIEARLSFLETSSKSLSREISVRIADKHKTGPSATYPPPGDQT